MTSLARYYEPHLTQRSNATELIVGDDRYCPSTTVNGMSSAYSDATTRMIASPG
ncbi:hypothetical protein IF188_15805 [Microbacterium sp. NEAU-LLC]|uniref:Uncharacterized protein n=1 Tax=Microbacterium helvum TaxID=2773713 RepID=A0ABR8NR93_9MICO|nr:hypothetical protein [Microbacterium helvum]MBD3943158.1 hypothetical protein [Microbacterium helvum]